MTSPLDRLLAKHGKVAADLPAKSTAGRIMHRGGVKSTSELDRILSLPVYRWQDDPHIEDLRKFLEGELALPPVLSCRPRCGHQEPVKACRECTRAREACACRGTGVMHLRPVQVAVLQAIHDHGGALVNARVGAGKTLCSWLGSSVARVERGLVLVPASLKKKTLRDFAYLKRHWVSPVRLHVMSYELLARDRGLAELSAYRPDFIAADEAYSLKNTGAVCAIRLHKYLTRENPECGYLDMSGTMTKRSILDYHHRMMWAVPDGLQPLPRKHVEVRDWADAIDEKTSTTGRLLPGALLRMCTDEEIKRIGEDNRKSTAIEITRTAYARRLMSAPAVVGTEEMFDGAMSLRITGHEFEPNQAVKDAFRSLRDNWCLPDGHPIDSPADLWRHARELIQGLFYKWDPPPPREWLMLRKIWGATVRQVLRDYKDLEPHSGLGVVRMIDDGQIEWAKDALENWRAVKDTYTPNTVATWIDDSCLKWVEGWAVKNTGIIWCWETKFAQRLSERTGLPYYGSKGLCGKKMIEDERGTCIASIKANYKGRNLQHYSNNLIVSIPPGGEMHEQLIGRTHRDFQEADEVGVDLLLGCYEQWHVFRQARRDAEYVERTMVQAQKLNFADVDVQDEAEIAQRHAAGDPLWCKDNAQFFEDDSEFTEREKQISGLSAIQRMRLRKGMQR